MKIGTRQSVITGILITLTVFISSTIIMVIMHKELRR